MNLKSLLTFATLTAVTTAMAAVTSETELCRIEVNSGTKSTIISLPLEDVSVDEKDAGKISITSLVLTDNLSENDTLIAVKDNKSYSWVLGSNREWTAATTVSTVTGVTGSGDAGSVTQLDCGNAIWVVRQDASKPFYLYGQVGKTAVKNPTIKGGDATTHTYTMIGNPNPADIDDINTIAWQNPQLGDQIVWGSATAGLGVNLYSYRTIADGATKDAWGYYDVVKDETSGRNKIVWKTENIKLPAGQGFWYITKSSGERGITWTSETTAEQ